MRMRAPYRGDQSHRKGDVCGCQRLPKPRLLEAGATKRTGLTSMAHGKVGVFGGRPSTFLLAETRQAVPSMQGSQAVE